MADDMTTNGSDAARVYQDAIQAQQGERITNLGRRQSDLETEVRSGFKQIDVAMLSLAEEMRRGIAGLTTNMAERNRVQWPAIGVAVTFCTVLGGVFAYPVNSAITRLDSTLGVISEKMVTRQEMDWRSARGAEDRTRIESAVAQLRTDQVPRAELERVWDGYNQRFVDQQRQLDAMAATNGSTYTPRDALLDIKAKQERIEAELNRLRAGN
jgi:hypothetical protein